jgi:hypothetical protein
MIRCNKNVQRSNNSKPIGEHRDEIVACHEAGGREGGDAGDRRVDFQAGGLGAGVGVPQPDRFVLGVRGEPPVLQHAQRSDRCSTDCPGIQDFSKWNT